MVYAVRLGYKVAEEQVRKGSSAARRLRQASIDTGSGDVGEVLASGLRIYRQVGEMLVEVAETLGASSRIWSHLYAKYQDQSKPTTQSVPAQDLNASLGKLADVVADKVSETIDQANADDKTSSAFGALLKQMSPAAAAMLGAKPAGATKPEAQASGTHAQPPVAAFVDPPAGFIGLAALEMVRDPPRGKKPVCGGLVMGERVLRAEVIIVRKRGEWEATVDARENDGAAEGSYRGSVHADGHNLGFLVVTLRKRAARPARGANPLERD